MITHDLKVFIASPVKYGNRLSYDHCSDTTCGGTKYSYGFFVQSILADRYIHRREM